jgi:hypothetical protein
MNKFCQFLYVALFMQCAVFSAWATTTLSVNGVFDSTVCTTNPSTTSIVPGVDTCSLGWSATTGYFYSRGPNNYDDVSVVEHIKITPYAVSKSVTVDTATAFTGGGSVVNAKMIPGNDVIPEYIIGNSGGVDVDTGTLEIIFLR